jgi:hypothetical protein
VTALRAAAVALATLALAPASAAAASAGPPGPLPTAPAAPGGRLVVALDLSGAFSPALEKDFGNGLTNVAAIYVTVVPESGGPPVALFSRVVDILFDVWEETYTVTVKDPRTPWGVRRVLPDFPSLLRFLREERGIDLGPLAAVPPGRFYVEARVEVNPVSKEQLQRTREYIANPVGARAGGGGSRSVLGAVASFLLREPEPGSDVRRLRSRPFAPEEVAGP